MQARYDEYAEENTAARGAVNQRYNDYNPWQALAKASLILVLCLEAPTSCVRFRLASKRFVSYYKPA